jgi:TolB protein
MDWHVLDDLDHDTPAKSGLATLLSDMRKPMRNALILVAACWILSVIAWAGELAGYRLVVASFRTGDTELFIVDPDTGDARNLRRSPGSGERYPSWSPDGRVVAFNSNRDGTHNLYLIGADGSNVRQFTHEKPGIDAGMQSWTADGRWIYFGLFGGGAPRMCRIHADGSGFEVIGHGGIDPAVSPDGSTIVYAREVRGGHCLFAADGSGGHERQLTSRPNPFAGVHATWTPDGRHVIHADAAGDALELFRCDPNNGETKQLTSFGKGQAATSPAVSPDGKWISFRLCDEIYWRDGKTSARAYNERRGDKRPVWIMGIDGSNPRVVEPLHFQTTIDGSRSPWMPK